MNTNGSHIRIFCSLVGPKIKGTIPPYSPVLHLYNLIEAALATAHWRG